MKNSNKELFRRLGHSSAPGMIVTGAIEIGASLTKFAKGDIDTEELLSELGEKGSCAVAASFGATLGSAVLPVIGTFVGGMIGHTVCSMIYNSSLTILKDAKIARARRIQIEEICKQAILQMEIYREDLKRAAEIQKGERDRTFDTFFDNLLKFEKTQDVNQLFSNIDTVGDYFGIESEFKTFEEFDDFMNDEDSVLSF